jgi:hypothetical protein
MGNGKDTAADGGVFEGLDPKLTVFALANGMDLAKGEGYRRLEWFTEGLERGILIEAEPSGGVRVLVLTWKTGHADRLVSEDVARDVEPGSVTKLLDDAIETANALGAPPAD